MWCIKSDFINTYFHFYSPFTITSIFSFFFYKIFKYVFKQKKQFFIITVLIKSFFIFYLITHHFYFFFIFLIIKLIPIRFILLLILVTYFQLPIQNIPYSIHVLPKK